MKKNLLLPFLLGCINMLFAQNKISIASPDKKIQFTFSAASGQPEYAVRYQNTTLINHSTIGLTFIGNDFFDNDIKTGHAIITNGIDDYVLPEGKTSKVYDHYTETVIPMQERTGKMRTVNLRVKVFNDGVAFRYEFPEQKNWNNYVLTDEHTSFNLSGNPTARVAFLENFTTSHEHRYNVMPLNAIANDTLMDMPALFEFKGNIFMGITEANLVDYAGMSLIKHNGILSAQLSPPILAQVCRVAMSVGVLVPLIPQLNFVASYSCAVGFVLSFTEA